MRLIMVGTVVAACLSSCDVKRIYEDYHTFDEAFWHMDSVIRFTFTIDNPDLAYDVYANFRNSSSYGFYNLYYRYSLKDSLEKEIISEQNEILLFDPKTGEPYGSGLGDMFDHSQPILRNFIFPDSGRYYIDFKHFMRNEELKFILSVGTRVEISE